MRNRRATLISHHIDAPVVRFRDCDLDGDYNDTGDDTLYYTNDANMNVTGLIDADTGNIVERYEYTAYGEVTVLDADFSADADNASDYDNRILYCGYRHDPATGLYHIRHRYYHCTLGRWTSRDPLGYVDGMNVYEYVASNPLVLLDPTGTSAGNGIAHIWLDECQTHSFKLDVLGAVRQMILDGRTGEAKKKRHQARQRPPRFRNRPGKGVKNVDASLDIEICPGCCTDGRHLLAARWKIAGNAAVSGTYHFPPIYVGGPFSIRISASLNGSVGGSFTWDRCSHTPGGSLGGQVAFTLKAQVGVDAGILAVGVHGKGSVTAVFAVVVNHPKCDGEVCLETGISGSAAFGITATVGYGYFSYTWEKDVYKLTTDKLMAYPVLYAGDGS